MDGAGLSTDGDRHPENGGTMTARRIDAMHLLYGTDPEHRKCGACPHFTKTTPSDRSYFKCEIYGNTESASTDWRRKYPACRLIAAPDFQQQRPIIHCLPRFIRDPEPLPGQVTIEDLISG